MTAPWQLGPLMGQTVGPDTFCVHLLNRRTACATTVYRRFHVLLCACLTCCFPRAVIEINP